MITNLEFILAVVVGFLSLCWSANRLVEAASTLAFRLGMPLLSIGVTVVAFGTSAPELMVSSVAAYNGSVGVSIGNVVGSNIVNIGLILAVGGLIRPLVVKSRIAYRELLILLVSTVVSALMLVDGSLSVWDALVLCTAFLFYCFHLLRSSAAPEAEQDIPVLSISTPRALAESALMLLILVLGSQLLVWGAKEVALALGVNELIIGLTLVAFGTSLPELATVVASARKGLHDMVVATVIGSNIFNLLAVLGFSGLIGGGIAVDAESLRTDIMAMVFITLVLVVVIFSSKVSESDGAIRKIGKYKCCGLLILYGIYIVRLILSSI